jgi:hypothetical protein
VDPDPSSSQAPKKRLRITNDQDSAHLVRVCINNFGCYGELRKDKFFNRIGELYGEEKNTQPLVVRSWLSRRENIRKEEIPAGEFV